MLDDLQVDQTRLDSRDPQDDCNRSDEHAAMDNVAPVAGGPRGPVNVPSGGLPPLDEAGPQLIEARLFGQRNLHIATPPRTKREPAPA